MRSIPGVLVVFLWAASTAHAASDPPTGTGTATPSSLAAGDSVVLGAAVQSGANPASTSFTVACDAGAIGGSATQALFDDGTNGDPTAGDQQFAFATSVGATVGFGAKSLVCTVTDDLARSSTFPISLTVNAVCGDGRIEDTEVCDDGGTENDDGCSATCTEEAGWDCQGEPSACASLCGDGLVVGAEECDDGDLDPGDGCDDACIVEDGWNCTPGDPSVCTEGARCGDGIVDPFEGCDDGNDVGDDGCDATCEVETGFACSGEPSSCDPDGDGDGIADDADNCPAESNPNQLDADGNGVGDACEDAPPPDDGGCCSSGGDRGGLLLGLLTALLLYGRLISRTRSAARRSRR